MSAAVRLFQPEQPEQITVQKVIKHFLDDLRLRVRARSFDARSLATAEWYLGSFAAMFGAIAIEICRPSDLTQWLLAHPEWKSANTKSDAVGRVVSCFKWAAGDGMLIETNPYHRDSRLVGRPIPKEAMTPAEFRAMLRLARECRGGAGVRSRPSRYPFRIYLWFLWQTGMRTCEARELTWEQIDWSLGVIRLVKHKTVASTGEARIIGLHDGVLRLLRWHRKKTGGLGYVFLNSRGRPWTKDTYAKIYRKYADLAGVRPCVSAYCARHGFTVRGIEAGLSNRMLADALGHSTTRYVDAVYGRCSRVKPDHLRNVAQKMREKRHGQE